MSFRRYTRELYDRPNASLPHLKTQMMKSDVVEAFLHGCATWTPLKGHYSKLRVMHITECYYESSEPGASRRTTAIYSTKTLSSEMHVRVTKQPCVRGGCFGLGPCSAWATIRYPRGSCRQNERTRDSVVRGGKEEIDGLRARGLSGVCRHGGLEYHRTRPWGLVQHSM